MYEPARLPGNSIPLASTISHQRSTDVDPVALWQSFVGTLSRRRKLFAYIVLGVIGAVFIVTILTPKRYTTDVKMIAGNPNSVASNPQQAQTGLPFLNALMLANAAQSAETYAELISETPVVQHVIDDLGLKTDVRTLQAAVHVKPVTNTNIISVMVTWSDPETSAKIANDFATVFVAREAQLVSGQATGALDFLSKQLPEAQRNLQQAEAAVSQYETSHHIADLPTETTSIVNAASAIDAKINSTQLEKQQADAQIALALGPGGRDEVDDRRRSKRRAEPGAAAAQHAAHAAPGTALRRAGAVHRFAPDGDQPQAAGRRGQAADRRDAHDDRRDDEHDREPGLPDAPAAARRRALDELERRARSSPCWRSSARR